MKQQRSNPPALADYAAMAHFSSSVRVGEMIWVSGTVGARPDGTPVDGMPAQARLAFQTLRAVLEDAGSSLADVVELVTFHTDVQGEMREFVKAKDEFFPDTYPAWSAVGVTDLAIPGLLVEVRAVAVAGSGSTETNEEQS